MATDIIQKRTARIVDLTGLPEPVVQQVEELVQQARRKLAEEAKPSPKEGPDQVGQEMVTGEFPRFISDPNPTPGQFSKLLDEMASMGVGKPLPPDFSRADIYDDHD